MGLSLWGQPTLKGDFSRPWVRKAACGGHRERGGGKAKSQGANTYPGVAGVPSASKSTHAEVLQAIKSRFLHLQRAILHKINLL